MKKEGSYYVYILASKKNGVLYVGVTSNLQLRIFQHRSGVFNGFASKYHVKKLVYYELFSTMYDAIHREKCMKKWKREWKINLIAESNPNWLDLGNEL